MRLEGIYSTAKELGALFTGPILRQMLSAFDIHSLPRIHVEK